MIGVREVDSAKVRAVQEHVHQVAFARHSLQHDFQLRRRTIGFDITYRERRRYWIAADDLSEEVFSVAIAQAGEIDHPLLALRRVSKTLRASGGRFAGHTGNIDARAASLAVNEVVGLRVVGWRIDTLAVKLEVVVRSKAVVGRNADRNSTTVAVKLQLLRV